MMNTHLRRAALGLLAVLAVGGSPGRAGADPHSGKPAEECRHGDSELNFVYLRDGDRVSMAGNDKDVERARRYRQGSEPLLWFRDGNQDHVIRDPATLKQIDAVWKPIEELADAQGKLGSEQGELGRQQGELGARQGVLGTRQGALSVREASLSMREVSEALSDDERAQVARQRREIKNQLRALDKQMRALERPMKELGDRMEVLGREMSALGKKIEAASQKAMADLRTLTRRAITSGAARPVK